MPKIISTMGKKGILFVISGPSGVGKGTLRENLIGKPIGDLVYSISATTRAPRAGEVEGRDYFYFEKSEFEAAIAGQEFLEWAQVYEHYYGTPKKYVLDCLEAGHDVLLEIDIQGALNVRKLVPKGVFIFVLPPSVEELGRRLVMRGKDSPAEIERRMRCCEEEISRVSHYDYAVVNDDVDEATDKLRSIIIAERCRINR